MGGYLGSKLTGSNLTDGRRQCVDVAHAGGECRRYAYASAGREAVAVNGENAVLVEQRLRQRDIVVVAGSPAQPERGDRAVERGILGGHDLDLWEVANGMDPAVAQEYSV